MPGFPIPLGGASFDKRTSYERLVDQIKRLYGVGPFTDVSGSVFDRTVWVIADAMAGPTLAVLRLAENAFPHRAVDLLSKWEKWYRLPPVSLSIAARQQRLLKHRRERPDARLWKIANALEEIVGVGNVVPRQNTAAALDLAGLSRRGMWVVAFGVPAAAIKTLGQIAELDALIARWKPVTVMGHVARTLGGGFLTDDDESLTDRDVLED